MKILFPKEGEKVVCKKCKNELEDNFDYSDSGDEDYRWCNFCIDYVVSSIARGD